MADTTRVPSNDHDWLRTALCEAAGCTHEAYAGRNRHAPNCMQDEVNLALDELEAENQQLRSLLDTNTGADK